MSSKDDCALVSIEKERSAVCIITSENLNLCIAIHQLFSSSFNCQSFLASFSRLLFPMNTLDPMRDLLDSLFPPTPVAK